MNARPRRCAPPLVLCLCALAPNCFAQEGAAPNGAPPDGGAVQGESRTSGEWYALLKEWRPKLDVAGPERDATLRRIEELQDPAASDALIRLLKREKSSHVREWYLRALARIGGESVAELLAELSIVDPQRHVRAAAAELLAAEADIQRTIPTFVSYLKAPKYRRQAAISLSTSGITKNASPGEPLDKNLVYGLINALIAEGVKPVPVTYWWYRYSGSARPGGGSHFHGERGGRRTVVGVKFPLPVPEVYEALKSYAGVDHGYDRDAWRSWARNDETISE